MGESVYQQLINRKLIIFEFFDSWRSFQFAINVSQKQKKRENTYRSVEKLFPDIFIVF